MQNYSKNKVTRKTLFKTADVWAINLMVRHNNNITAKSLITAVDYITRYVNVTMNLKGHAIRRAEICTNRKDFFKH